MSQFDDEEARALADFTGDLFEQGRRAGLAEADAKWKQREAKLTAERDDHEQARAEAEVQLQDLFSRVTRLERERDEARRIAEEASDAGVAEGHFAAEEAVLPWEDYDAAVRRRGGSHEQ